MFLDGLLERNVKILQLSDATNRNKRSLQNWIAGTGSVCAQEAIYLDQRDLCTAESTIEGGLGALENIVECIFVVICIVFRKVGDHSLPN